MKFLFCVSIAFLYTIAWPSPAAIGQDTAAAGDSELVQVSNGDLPTAKEVIDAHVKAVGGEEKYASIHTLRMEGELSTQGVSGAIKIYKKGDKVFTGIDFGEMGERKSGFDGETAWEETTGQAVRKLEGDEAEQLKEQADLTPLLDFEQKYDKVECVGEEDFNNEKCYVLVFEKKGKESKQFFSIERGFRLACECRKGAPSNPFKSRLLSRNTAILTG